MDNELEYGQFCITIKEMEDELNSKKLYMESMDESTCNYNFTEDPDKAFTIRPLKLSQFDLESQILIDWITGQDLDWYLYST